MPGQFSDEAFSQDRRRHLRQLTIGLQKTIQGGGAALNDLQSAIEVLALLGIESAAGKSRAQTACKGLNGGERVGQVVADDAYQALPSLPFLLAQGTADIREHDQGVRNAF